jgi:hypothetical protein
LLYPGRHLISRPLISDVIHNWQGFGDKKG